MAADIDRSVFVSGLLWEPHLHGNPSQSGLELELREGYVELRHT